MKLSPLRALPLLILSAFFVCTTMQQATGAEATKEAAKPKSFSPEDLENLRGERGNAVTVTGTIMAAGESKSKSVRYLNFTSNYRDSIALVFFVNKGGELFAMEKLHAWVGKKVRATGVASEYGSTMQIEIAKWDQIEEIKETK